MSPAAMQQGRGKIASRLVRCTTPTEFFSKRRKNCSSECGAERTVAVAARGPGLGVDVYHPRESRGPGGPGLPRTAPHRPAQPSLAPTPFPSRPAGRRAP